MNDNNQWSSESMLARMREAKGRALTVEEEQRIVSMADEIELLEGRLAESTARDNQRESERALLRRIRQDERAKRKEELDKEAESIRLEFAEALKHNPYPRFWATVLWLVDFVFTKLGFLLMIPAIPFLLWKRWTERKRE